jgi:hypothetical protein
MIRALALPCRQRLGRAPAPVIRERKIVREGLVLLFEPLHSECRDVVQTLTRGSQYGRLGSLIRNEHELPPLRLQGAVPKEIARLVNNERGLQL